MQIHGYHPEIRLVTVYKFLVMATLLCGVINGSKAIAQAQGASKNDEVEQLRKTVRQLTAEVTRLKADNAKLEKYRQVDYLREQLMKEEQRVESLQKDLTDIGAREMALQRRLDEIEPQLQPGQIEQARAGVGSMRPEEDREAARRQLLNEKRRIQTQLDQFQQNRVRDQSSISSAEASIVTLRQRLKDAVRAAGLPNTLMN